MHLLRTTRQRRALAIVAIALSLGAAISACSLGNVKHDPCKDDAQCASAFGAGSKCVAGYCSEPMSNPMVDCDKTAPDGRACFGCAPKKTVEFHNACTGAACEPFDPKRLTKLTPDGGLPPLP